MMPKLLDLPNEILQQICNEVWWQWLSALCLVHSRLRAITQPILLRRSAWHAYNVGVLYLLRTIVECSHLRHHITELRIDNHYFELPYEATPLIGAIKSLNVEFDEEWCKRIHLTETGILREYAADAITALFWALLPNLKKVHFAWPSTPGSILGKVISMGLLPSWTSVQDIKIFPWMWRDQFKFAEGVRLLTMPQLRRVKIREICANDESLDLKPKSVAARHLSLTEAGFTTAALRSLIASCTALEHLRIYQIDVPSPPRAIVDLIAVHAATLKVLNLDFAHFPFFYPRIGDPHDYCIGSWDAFPELQELSIDQGVLQYSRHEIVLPKRLKMLTVVAMDDHFLPALQGLVERQKDEYKELAKVRLKYLTPIPWPDFAKILRADGAMYSETPNTEMWLNLQ